jgi:nucleoside diphosphate kinase
MTAYVLSRENAIEEWRQLMGPVDPDEARAKHPTRFVS